MTVRNVFQHGEVIDSVYLTTGGRIVIPVRLRRKLGIKPGILFQALTKQNS